MGDPLPEPPVCKELQALIDDPSKPVAKRFFYPPPNDTYVPATYNFVEDAKARGWGYTEDIAYVMMKNNFTNGGNWTTESRRYLFDEVFWGEMPLYGLLNELWVAFSTVLKGLPWFLKFCDPAMLPYFDNVLREQTANCRGPYDIMPVSDLNAESFYKFPVWWANQVQSLKATLAPVNFPSEKTTYSKWLKVKPWNAKFEEFVNRLAFEYAKVFQSPTASTTSAWEDADTQLRRALSEYISKAYRIEQEYVVIWEVYRRLRNSHTLLQFMMQLSRAADDALNVIRPGLDLFTNLCIDMQCLARSGEFGEIRRLVNTDWENAVSDADRIKLLKLYNTKFLQIENKKRLYGNNVFITESPQSTVYGVCHLGLPSDTGINVIFIDQESSGFRLKSSNPNSVSGISWLTLPQNDARLKWGYTEVALNRSSTRVQFSSAFANGEQPEVFVWLTSFHFRNKGSGPAPIVQCSAANISNTAFDIQVQHGLTEQERQSNSASTLPATRVGWLAYPSSRGGTDIRARTTRATVPDVVRNIRGVETVWNGKMLLKYGLQQETLERPPTVASFITGFKALGSVKALTQYETCASQVIDTDCTEWVEFTTIAYQPPVADNWAVWLNV